MAPGVDIIAPYINNNYAKARNRVSSSLACGVMAINYREYINNQGTYASRALYTRVLKTYLMLEQQKVQYIHIPMIHKDMGINYKGQ